MVRTTCLGSKINNEPAKIHMPVKSLTLIALVLIVPVAVLTFFAVRSLSLENDALNVRHERLAKQRIDAAAALVLARLQDLGTQVWGQTQAAYATGGTGALSSLTRKRIFAYAFVSKMGTQLYSATALEHQYDSTRQLQDGAQALAAKLSASEPSAEAFVPYGGSFALMHCSRSASDHDICVAVDESKVMDLLRSQLGLVARSTGLTRVGLVDPNGSAIGIEDSAALSTASQPLHGLLNGWQLRVEEPLSGDRSLQNTLPLYLVAAALIAGWLAMTWMLHQSLVLKDEAAAARANVIAELAHELRTPLANLQLHTELLRVNSSDGTAVQRYGAILNAEIGRLTLLAENAIAVARGAIVLPKLETTVPDDCLHAILDRFEPMLADASCRVRFTPGADKLSHFDRMSWERCFINLIDNARKYASGSAIEITTAQTSEMLRLDVSDRGPGIAANQEEKIFEPLERGTTMTKAGGFGLGLAAVRALARQNGGNCWVESMNPGAHFVLTMQARPVEAAAMEHASKC